MLVLVNCLSDIRYCPHHDFSEVADVTDFLANEVLDTLDFGGLLEDESCWWLVKKSAETLHVDAAVLGGEDVNHGFEAHIHCA